MLQLSQRPLAPTDADAELFVGRDDEMAKLLRSVELQFNTLLLGARGSGRTSLLRQLEYRLRETATVHYVRGAAAATVDQLVEAVRDAVHGPRVVNPLAPFDPAAGIRPRAVPSPNAKLRSLGSGIEGRPVLLVDEIEDPELAYRLFGRLRDEVWELPFVWIISGDSEARSTYLRPPADAFYDVVVDLGELTQSAARELVKRRLVGADGDLAPQVAAVEVSLSQLVDCTDPCTPRALLAAARQAVMSTGSPDDTIGAMSSLQMRAAELGRAPAMMLTELAALGPRSASDPELLKRMGWTRSRAAQVLGQLETAGLVVAHQERTPKASGRPRKVYAVNLQKAGSL